MGGGVPKVPNTSETETPSGSVLLPDSNRRIPQTQADVSHSALPSVFFLFRYGSGPAEPAVGGRSLMRLRVWTKKSVKWSEA